MRTIAALFLSLIILTACSSEQEAPKVETPVIPVLAAKPVVKDVPVYLESIGTLHPSVFIEVRPQVSGIISEVLVKEGDLVTPGMPLLKIDSKSYEIKVKEAEAQLAMDHAAYQAAEKKLDRFRILARKDLIAQTEWDELETQALKAQAAIDLDETRLSAAKLDLEHCTIAAPVDGRIGKLDIHPGHLVHSEPLLSISKLDPLLVEFTITEKEFPKISQHKLECELQTLCSSDCYKKAAVTFFDNNFDSKTGLLLVRGTMENAQQQLRPGQNIRVRVPVSINANAKLIPQKSIRYSQEGPYIYVVQPDTTVGFRQVLLGQEVGSDVIVNEGVDATDLIITDGHLRLSPGAKVEIK